VADINDFSGCATLRSKVFPVCRPAERPAPSSPTPHLADDPTGDPAASPAADPPAQVLRPDPAEQARYEQLLARLPGTLGALFADRVRLSPHREAFRVPGPDGRWTAWTWSDCAVVVREIAAGLLGLGVSPGQPVAIASTTRLEWVLTDLAVAYAGAATTTLDPGLPPDEVGRLLGDSGARVVVAEDGEQLARVRDHWGRLPDLVAVVVIDERALGPGSPHVDDRRVLSLASLRDCGRAVLASDPQALQRAADSVRPDSLASVLYTSGTTGPAKGVRQPHSAWVSAAAANTATGLLTEDDVQYLWAPLSHSFGKALLATQLVVGFSSAVCGDPGRLVEGMAQVRPTFVPGPPRLFQRVHARARADLEAAGPVRHRLNSWAFDVGRQAAAARRAGRRLPLSQLPALAVADQLALRAVREHFGGRVRHLACGTAPLSEDVANWYAAAGIDLLGGYGLTETTTVVALPRGDGICPGTLGRPLAGTEVRLTDSGRVQVRGPGVMLGYQNGPEETARVLSPDGWLSTGDLGRVVDGCLRITGRVQDLITTGTGARVAPQDLQVRLGALCPYLSHVLVVGEGRASLGALVTLDADALATWASSHGLAGSPYEEVVRSEQARAMVSERLAALNAGLEPGHGIEWFSVLPRDLNVADGELTPALVPRRPEVERRWGADPEDR